VTDLWWLCPNDPPCPHGRILHDGDGYDEPYMCCVDGCGCDGDTQHIGEPTTTTAPATTPATSTPATSTAASSEITVTTQAVPTETTEAP
jgi:hypothetical protein